MSVNASTNPQVSESVDSGEKGIDKAAEDMATKAGKVEQTTEKEGDVVGGVRSNSGGLFTK